MAETETGLELGGFRVAGAKSRCGSYWYWVYCLQGA